MHNQSLGVATSDDAEAALTPQLADAVQTRLLVAQERERINVRPQNARELLDSVSTARVSFQRSVRRMRVAFAFARIAERISLSDVQGALIIRKGAGAHGLDSLDTLSAVLRGRMSSQVRYVCMAVRYVQHECLRCTRINLLLQETVTFEVACLAAGLALVPVRPAERGCAPGRGRRAHLDRRAPERTSERRRRPRSRRAGASGRGDEGARG